MGICTCGKQLTVLSNGYTVCEQCRDTRDNLRIERDTLKAENARLTSMVEFMRDNAHDEAIVDEMLYSHIRGFMDTTGFGEGNIASEALKDVTNG